MLLKVSFYIVCIAIPDACFFPLRVFLVRMIGQATFFSFHLRVHRGGGVDPHLNIYIIAPKTARKEEVTFTTLSSA